MRRPPIIHITMAEIAMMWECARMTGKAVITLALINPVKVSQAAPKT
jgi:hypothetical protein